MGLRERFPENAEGQAELVRRRASSSLGVPGVWLVAFHLPPGSNGPSGAPRAGTASLLAKVPVTTTVPPGALGHLALGL